MALAPDLNLYSFFSIQKILNRRVLSLEWRQAAKRWIVSIKHSDSEHKHIRDWKRRQSYKTVYVINIRLKDLHILLTIANDPFHCTSSFRMKKTKPLQWISPPWTFLSSSLNNCSMLEMEIVVFLCKIIEVLWLIIKISIQEIKRFLLLEPRC